MKFVDPLSQLEQQWLEQVETSHQESNRTRSRAQAIRLSASGFPIKEIATVCRAHRSTISAWIDQWKQCGFDSLIELPRPGRNTILLERDYPLVLQIVNDHPRQSKRALAEIQQQLRVTLSSDTLKRFLKKTNIPGNESESL